MKFMLGFVTGFLASGLFAYHVGMPSLREALEDSDLMEGVLRRVVNDNGERTDLDAVLAEFGLTREDLDGT